MHTLNLSRPAFFGWKYKYKHIPVPSKYNELNGRQLRYICLASHSPGTIYQQRARILQALVQKPRAWFRQFNPVQVYEMSYLTDWLYEKNNDHLVLRRPDLTEQLIPTLRVPVGLKTLGNFRHVFKTYYGPAKGLGNSSMLELALADREYLRFLKTGKEDYLNRLVAILYRERNPKVKQTAADFNGDFRLQVNDFTVSTRAKLFSTLDMGTKLAVFYFFEGCRTKIVENPSFRLVFQNTKADEVAKNQDLTWINLILQLGGFTQRSQSEVEETNCYTVLHKLQQTLEIQAKNNP